MQRMHHFSSMGASEPESAFNSLLAGISGYGVGHLHQSHDAYDRVRVSAVRSDQVQPLADHDGLQAAVDMQFVHGVLDMVSRGCFAHAHHLCDFTGRIAIGQQLKNLQFAFGQPGALEFPVVPVVVVMVFGMFW